MGLTLTKLGELAKWAQPVEGEPEYSGRLSPEVLRQWAKNTLAVAGGVGVGYGLGKTLYDGYQGSPMHAQVGGSPEFLVPAAAAVGGGAMTLGYLVRKRQRELLEGAQAQAAQPNAEQRRGPAPGGSPPVRHTAAP